MKKSLLRLTLICSTLLFAMILSACGGSATPPTNPGTTGGETPTEEATETSSEAAAIIQNAQTASSIDPEELTPLDSESAFQAGDSVYVTFDIVLEGVTPQDGYYGNIKIEFYNDGSLYTEGTLDDLAENDTDPSEPIPAYFAMDDYDATAAGQAMLYWCATEDCSDPQLAQTVTFTVA